jgi:hypothetical protein
MIARSGRLVVAAPLRASGPATSSGRGLLGAQGLGFGVAQAVEDGHGLNAGPTGVVGVAAVLVGVDRAGAVVVPDRPPGPVSGPVDAAAVAGRSASLAISRAYKSPDVLLGARDLLGEQDAKAPSTAVPRGTTGPLSAGTGAPPLTRASRSPDGGRRAKVQSMGGGRRTRRAAVVRARPIRLVVECEDCKARIPVPSAGHTPRWCRRCRARRRQDEREQRRRLGEDGRTQEH